jgi:hypothetical protein
MTEFSKDPDAILDYQVDWSDWLVTDTISTSVWTVPTGITAGNGINGAPAPSNTTTTATIWLLGGTANKAYMVTNRITTAAGRTNDYSLKIFVTQL